MTPDAFTKLIEGLDSEQHRERLHNLRHELKLPGDDPVWALVAVQQEFCRSLLASTREEVTPRRAAGPADTHIHCWWRRPLAMFCAGSACTTALMTLSFCIGVRSAAGHPSWLAAPGAGSWAATFLRVPAGWMLLVEVLPLLVYVSYCGLRALQTDALAGWTLFAASLAAALIGTVAVAWILVLG